MFTVKDVVHLLEANEFFINWNGGLTPLDTECELQMDAYGDYVVKKVTRSHGANSFELMIKATPVKMEV